MMSDSAIEVLNLRKSFGDVVAVDGVGFTVRQGEIFSLLGPNGAGKTTTISILSGLLRPDEGDAWILGFSIRQNLMEVKKLLGVVPQEIALYEDLTAHENLIFWGKMYGLRGTALKSRVGEVLEIIGLQERAKRRVSTFSGGMKRRLNNGVALLHKPQVIYMDEPTVGIDPQSRRNILDSVIALKNEGMTVLYTTHYMEEAQELSDRIGILDHGRMIACGSHDELVKLVGSKTRIELSVVGDAAGAFSAWRLVEGVSHIDLSEKTLTLLVDDSHAVLARLFEVAARLSLHVQSVNIQEPNLESVFLHLTGRALRD